MPEPDNEPQWITGIDSKYRLVLLAAKRSKQLQRGAKPRIICPARKATRVALEEVQRGLVQYQTIAKSAK
ncbi:MAG: DNA-directed RNA polymerase subunit omega [Blastocatellia bacterium]